MNAARNRKIVYMLVIVALFSAQLPLGDYLGRVADQNKLSQQNLGDVDPVGGTAQLVCFGFRGVAVTFLWNEAIELNRKERWFEIRPVLTSITLLQPNFIRPWQYQAWNMAYNIAAQWESVQDKYYWITEGVKFMKDACDKNKDNPDLLWYVGFLYYNKFGVSDEHEYLRELFRKDADAAFTNSRRMREPHDPFDLAYDWFVDANNAVTQLKIKPIRMGITPFLSHPAKALTSYADFLGKEGRYGLHSREAWREAYDAWLQYGRAYNYVRPDNISEREAFIHRLEYEPAEWNALSEENKYWVERNSDIVRYRYWKTLARAEATPEMNEARESLYHADAERLNGNFIGDSSDKSATKGAKAYYEEAFPKWRAVLTKPEFKEIRTDSSLIEDLQKAESIYFSELNRWNQKVPEHRPFEGLFSPLVEAPAAKPSSDKAPSANLPLKPSAAVLKPSN